MTGNDYYFESAGSFDNGFHIFEPKRVSMLEYIYDNELYQIYINWCAEYAYERTEETARIFIEEFEEDMMAHQIIPSSLIGY